MNDCSAAKFFAAQSRGVSSAVIARGKRNSGEAVPLDGSPDEAIAKAAASFYFWAVWKLRREK